MSFAAINREALNQFNGAVRTVLALLLTECRDRDNLTQISSLILNHSGGILAFGASNSLSSGYRTRKSMRFFYALFPYGRGALSVRLCVALDSYLKPLLPDRWRETFKKYQGGLMTNINQNTQDDNIVTLLAIQQGLSAIYDWIQSIKVVADHQAINNDLSPDHINRMLGCLSKEVDILWVGIHERVTGEVENSSNTAMFYALEDRVIKKSE
jgi:hypothetical protein